MENYLNKIIRGDCLEVMKEIPSDSIDSVVTDPPYGISFMGKKWDYDVPSVEVWKEVLRVLKPGGHILAACGTRTQHRMAINLEDAGFEIRDLVAWVYGSGFPKNLNIGKELDKRRIGGKFEEIRDYLRISWKKSGITQAFLKRAMGDNTTGGGRISHYFGKEQASVPNWEDWLILKKELKLDDRFDDFLKEYEREIVGKSRTNLTVYQKIGGDNESGEIDITAPATEQAKQWEGWGTALKPAMELWTLARKPLSEKTVAENIIKWGTGGINIDGCRVQQESKITDVNRFPANFIHDGLETEWAKFFYTAKASKNERNKGLVKNHHPTVKPLSLMRYLVKLVTPPNGTVLDPFTGSGTTGIAAKVEGFNFIGIEKEDDYVKIAEARIIAWENEKDKQQLLNF